MQDQSAAKSFYDRISAAYDALTDANEHRVRERGLEMLGVSGGEVVLEIGYGTGHSLVELANAVGGDGAVHGVDISQGMHDVSESRVGKAGLDDRVQLRVAAVPPLPYDDETFDAVTMSFTLELFPSEVIPTVLAEVARVLKPDGRLGVVSMATVPEGDHESVMERAYKWMHRHFPHIVDCQPIDVERVLAASGLDVAQDDRIEIWTMPVAAVVAIPAARG